MESLCLSFPSNELLSVDDNIWSVFEVNVSELIDDLSRYNIEFVCCSEDAVARRYFTGKEARYSVSWVSVASQSDKRFLGLSDVLVTSSIDTSEFIKMALNRFKPVKQKVVSDIIAYNGARWSLAQSRIVYAYRKLIESDKFKFNVIISDTRGNSFVQGISPKQGDGKLIYKYNPFSKTSDIHFGGVPIGVKHVSVILGGV